MPGIAWYIAIATVSIGVSVFVFVKKKEPAKLAAYYLFATMVAYFGEVLVMMVFNSYSYKPGIFSDPYAENIIGHVIPNSTVWPAAAILSAAFSLRRRWLLLISAIFMAMDVLFVALGLYEHHWWKTWMTGIGILVYCFIMKDWYKKMERSRYSMLRYVMFSMILWFILFEPVALFLLLGKLTSNAGWYQNPYRDSVVFSTLYHAVLSFVSAYFMIVLRRWYWKLVPFVLIISSDFIILYVGILSFSGGWNILFLTLARIISLLLFIMMEKKYRYHPLIPAEKHMDPAR